MRFLTALVLVLVTAVGLVAEQPSKLKLSMVQPKGPVTGVWISDGYGKEDIHITTEGHGFVIGRNPTSPSFKFTDPALIFEKDGVRLQLRGVDGGAVSRPVPLHLAKKLLGDMLKQAVKDTEPAKLSTKAGGCRCGDGTSFCTCGPACDCDSDYWCRVVPIGLRK